MTLLWQVLIFKLFTDDMWQDERWREIGFFIALLKLIGKRLTTWSYFKQKSWFQFDSIHPSLPALFSAVLLSAMCTRMAQWWKAQIHCVHMRMKLSNSRLIYKTNWGAFSCQSPLSAIWHRQKHGKRNYVGLQLLHNHVEFQHYGR